MSSLVRRECAACGELEPGSDAGHDNGRHGKLRPEVRDTGSSPVGEVDVGEHWFVATRDGADVSAKQGRETSCLAARESLPR